MMKDAGARMLVADDNLLSILKDYDGPVLKTGDIRKLHLLPSEQDLYYAA